MLLGGDQDISCSLEEQKGLVLMWAVKINASQLNFMLKKKNSLKKGTKMIKIVDINDQIKETWPSCS